MQPLARAQGCPIIKCQKQENEAKKSKEQIKHQPSGKFLDTDQHDIQ